MLSGELAEAWIPAAYLESLDDDAFEESQELEPQKFVVTDRYSAKNGDELTLEEGDSIEVSNQSNCSFTKLLCKSTIIAVGAEEEPRRMVVREARGELRIFPRL